MNERLAEHRRRRGWSQAYVARELRRLADTDGERSSAVTANEVSRWERGVRSPRPRSVRLLCHLFALSARDLGLVDLDELPVAPPPPALGTMIGREVELQTLSRELGRAGSGSGRMVLISGDAGIGKTLLCRQLGTAAASQGYLVLSGSCASEGLSRPYLPFVEAVGSYLADANLPAVRRVLGPMCQELPRLFPQLRAGPSTSPAEDPDSQERLHEEVSALLGALADQHGLVLILEDIHWADASTRRLLNHLVRQVRSQRVLLACTVRAEELGLQPSLRVQVRAWSRVGTMIDMKPLDRLQVGELARDIERVELSDQTCELLHHRSGGNPYAVEELLKAAIREGGVAALARLGLPPTLREATLTRVRGLSGVHIDVVQAAAVLGETIDLETLDAVLGGDSTQTQAGLRACVDVLLLEQDAQSPRRLRFRHARTRQAIYEDLSPGRAQDLHARAARVLQAVNGRSVEVARHLIAAGSLRQAVVWCIRAAEDAARERAYGTAAELYEHALSHEDDPVRRAHIQCALGTSRLLAGEARAAEQPLIDGIDALEQLGHPVEAAHHRLTLARVRCGQSRVEMAHRDYELALATLDGHRPTLELAYGFLRLAKCMNDAGRPVAAVARRAIEIGTGLGERSIVLRAQAILAPEHLYRGRVQQGLAMLDATVEEALALRLERIAEQATFHAVIHHAHLDPAEAGRRLARLRVGGGGSRTSAMQSAAEAHYEAIVGNYAAALEHLERARDTYRSQRIVSWSRWVEAHMAVVHARLGRIDEARRWRPHHSEPPVHRALIAGLVGLDVGEPERGNDVVQLLQTPELVPVILHSMAADVAVAVLVAQDDVQGAKRVAMGVPPPHREVPDRHFRLMIQARVALAEGDFPRAAEALTAAADALEQVGCEEYERDVRLMLADALNRLGIQRGAAVQLRRVVEGAARRGSLLQLQRAGARMREQQSLTLREREVTRLVARGLTDPGIAGELSISVRTAESHVANIRRKLGGANRVEIAAWVAAQMAANSRGPG